MERNTTGTRARGIKCRAWFTVLVWLAAVLPLRAAVIQNNWVTNSSTAAITGLTADAAPDAANDFVVTYDASAGTLKKVALANLPTGGGGEANVGGNLGTGLFWYASKSGITLQFNSFTNADSSISVFSNANTISIAATNITSAKITDGAIVDADVNASAALARTKIASGSADHVIINNGSGVLSSEATLGAARFPALTGDVTTPGGSLATTIAANAVALGTDTTGNYIATETGTTFHIAITGSGSETAATTIDIDATATLAGNPALAASGIGFATTGIIFEGATANSNEGLVTADDVTADRTWTLPDRSGTVILSGDTLTGDVTATMENDGSTTTVIADNSVDGTDIALGSDAQGDIMYYNGTDYVRLAAGTSGHFLQTQGAGANPQWAASSGSGDITSVGDVASGAAFDGTQGTLLTFNHAAGDHTLSFDATEARFQFSTNVSANIFVATNGFQNVASASATIVVEGTTDDANETTLAFDDPTADRTITFPDRAGTVSLSGDTFTGDVTGTLSSSGATALTIAANSVALGTDSTGNYVATIAGTTFRVAVSGSGSETAAVTVDIDNTATLGGNPGLAANGIGFATTGFIFEGATANTSEGLLTMDDVTADRTYTLPDRSGTVTLSGDTFTSEVTGTISSSGATALTIADSVTVATWTMTGAPGLSLNNGATGSGVLRIMEDSDAGANYTEFQVPALAANVIYTLPPDDGTSGDQLTTDGAGVLTWAAAGSGSGDSILIDGVAVTDGSGVNVIGGTGVDITFNAGVSPDTATLVFDGTELQSGTTLGDGSASSWTFTFNIDAVGPTIEVRDDGNIVASNGATGPGAWAVAEDSDNGTSIGIFTSAAALGANRTYTGPDRSGTIALSGDTFTGDVTGTLNSSGATALTIAADSVALSTDTTGNYVQQVADGTGIDGSVNSEGGTYTPTLDLTEINNVTWGDGSQAAITNTHNVSTGTDPVIIFDNNLVEIRTGNFRVQALTASQAVLTDASTNLVSVATTGAGNVMRTRVGVVRSIDVPMGAWLTNGISSPATPGSWTNASDALGFVDAVTNTARLQVSLPITWGAGTVQWKFVMSSTLTNTTTSTNVVYGIKGASVANGGTWDSLTFGTQIAFTNHIHRSPYVGVECVTPAITVGNTPAANKPIVWELTRLTSDGTDVNTNTVSIVSAQLFYTETTTEPSAPAATN